jgi:predicted DNA-binding ribbon-helix-helix protein
VRRTQLYLEDDLWNALHARARRSRTTVSHLVREAIREQYLGKFEERSAAMRAFIGIRKVLPGFSDSEAYVRGLRRGSRLEKAARE